MVSRARADPRGFLEEAGTPALLDEIQHAPELLSYVRTLVDSRPGRAGQFFLTGSQEAPLMRGVTESLAGRAAVLQLLPLSIEESSRVSLLRGGYPEVVARPAAARLWFSSYVQTYLERDVRTVSAVRDLATFRRFLGLVATRSGQMLNKTDLAAPLGVSVPTITEWLGILEVTGQVALVPPWYESLGKRLVKTPKLYILDSGLAAHLLGIESERDLARSPFLGALFDGFVASEVLKRQQNRGRRRELYYFRDHQGLKVDFLVPTRGRKLLLLEAKASRTVRPEAADSLVRLSKAVEGRQPEGVVVFRGSEAGSPTHVLRPGVRALSLRDALGLVG